MQILHMFYGRELEIEKVVCVFGKKQPKRAFDPSLPSPNSSFQITRIFDITSDTYKYNNKKTIWMGALAYAILESEFRRVVRRATTLEVCELRASRGNLKVAALQAGQIARNG